MIATKRYHDRLGKPYKLEKGNRGAGIPPERLDPVRSTYFLTEPHIFEHVVRAIIANETVRARVLTVFSNERKTMKMETTLMLIASAVAPLRGFSEEEALAHVRRRVEAILEPGEVSCLERTKAPTARDLTRAERQRTVSKLSRWRRIDEPHRKFATKTEGDSEAPPRHPRS